MCILTPMHIMHRTQWTIFPCKTKLSQACVCVFSHKQPATSINNVRCIHAIKIHEVTRISGKKTWNNWVFSRFPSTNLRCLRLGFESILRWPIFFGKGFVTCWISSLSESIPSSQNPRFWTRLGSWWHRAESCQQRQPRYSGWNFSFQVFVNLGDCIMVVYSDTPWDWNIYLHWSHHFKSHSCRSLGHVNLSLCDYVYCVLALVCWGYMIHAYFCSQCEYVKKMHIIFSICMKHSACTCIVYSLYVFKIVLILCEIPFRWIPSKWVTYDRVRLAHRKKIEILRRRPDVHRPHYS